MLQKKKNRKVMESVGLHLNHQCGNPLVSQCNIMVSGGPDKEVWCVAGNTSNMLTNIKRHHTNICTFDFYCLLFYQEVVFSFFSQLVSVLYMLVCKLVLRMCEFLLIFCHCTKPYQTMTPKTEVRTKP